MRRPTFTSVVWFGCKPGLKAVFGSSFGSCVAPSLLLALTTIAVPIFAMPGSGLAAEPLHCLTGDEQRAAIAAGKTMPLATVIAYPASGAERRYQGSACARSPTG